jgi:hypothetical protein
MEPTQRLELCSASYKLAASPSMLGRRIGANPGTCTQRPVRTKDVQRYLCLISIFGSPRWTRTTACQPSEGRSRISRGRGIFGTRRWFRANPFQPVRPVSRVYKTHPLTRAVELNRLPERIRTSDAAPRMRGCVHHQGDCVCIRVLVRVAGFAPAASWFRARSSDC